MLLVIVLIKRNEQTYIWQTEWGSLKDLPVFGSIHVAFDANGFFYRK